MGCMEVIAIVVVELMALAAIGASIHVYSVKKRSHTFCITRGQVVSSEKEVERSVDANVVSHKLVIRYVYKGRCYEGQPFGYVAASVKKALAQYRPGDTLNVFVDPERPDRFVLSQEADALGFLAWQVAWWALAVFFPVALYYLR